MRCCLLFADACLLRLVSSVVFPVYCCVLFVGEIIHVRCLLRVDCLLMCLFVVCVLFVVVCCLLCCL